MKRLLFVLGTRPEAIKMAPAILHFRGLLQDFTVRVCLTGQHRELAKQALGLFGVEADVDLDLMQPGQTLSQLSARVLAGLEGVLASEKPDLVFVQGDTTTAFMGALAAFYAQVPVGHIEAGLRTGDLARPFPEEANRRLIAPLARLHFAATEAAWKNLRAEGIEGSHIVVTGNTGIDALFHVLGAMERGELEEPVWPLLNPAKKLVLVTGHRRENFGAGFERFCNALRRIASREDVQLVYPVHPNPNVREPVARLLGNLPGVALIDPLEYLPFVSLMRRAYLLITDSGGVQEEGPSLGKPILVTREVTERPEAVEAGTVRLVGTDEKAIVREATLLLDDGGEYERRARILNPYGDGKACGRIAEAVRQFFALAG